MIVLIYSVKMVACTVLFYSYYFFFLRNKQLHQFNRFYILLSLTFSMVLPIIKIPLLVTRYIEVSPKTLNSIAFGAWENNIILTGDNSFVHSIVTAQNMLLAVYLTVLSLTLYPVIKSLVYIRSLVRKHERKIVENIQFYETTEPGTPFSFANKVFWNKNISLESHAGQQILKHELFHINQKHSYDILFMQLLNAILWFNPVCYLMNKELKVIHEFLADSYAAGADKFRYAETMVLQAVSPQEVFLSNQFFYNQIKRRITMILQSNKTSYSYARKAMAIPVMFIIFCACSVKSKDDAIDRTFTKVEVESGFPGGNMAWQRYLNENFKYPMEAQEKEIQGTTVVQFIVEKDGTLTDIHAISGLEVLTKESIRVIKESGKWVPAMQNGHVVRSYKKQPITYKLEAE